MGNVVMQFDAETAKAVNGFLKIEDRQRALEQKQQKLSKSADKFNKTTRNGLKKNASSVGGLIDKYAKLGTGMISLTGLVTGLAQGFLKSKEAAEDTYKVIARLAAISGLDEKSRNMVVDNAGAVDPTVAFNTAFSGQSASFSDSQKKNLLREMNYAKAMGEDAGKFGGSLVSLKSGLFDKKTLPQISNFLSTAAENSPLSADEFSKQFLKVAGAAGSTDKERVAGGSILSAMIKAMGADADPERAATSTRNLLTNLSTDKAKSYFKEMGLGGLDSVSLVEKLSEYYSEGKLKDTDFHKIFGKENTPAIFTMLSSKDAISQIRSNTDKGVSALQDTDGLSLNAEKFEQLDPKVKKMFNVIRLKNQRKLSDIKAGYENADINQTYEATKSYLNKSGNENVGGTGIVGGLASIGVKQGLAMTGNYQPLIDEIANLVGYVKDQTDATRELAGNKTRVNVRPDMGE